MMFLIKSLFAMPRLSELKRYIYAILYKLTKNRRYYFYFKWRNINRVLHDENLLAIFRDGGSLPDKYGTGIDERIVEYPWVFSHLNDKPENILDAGSTFNFWPIVFHEKIKNKKLTVMTLAPEYKNYTSPNVSYVYGDLRSIPFADNYFDVISCISTIEHIGFDNSQYLNKNRVTAHADYNKKEPSDFIVAVEEFKRILRPGGALFITVPFGLRKDYNFFQEFDIDMISEIIKVLGQENVTVLYYKLGKTGWIKSNSSECHDTEYQYNFESDAGRVSSTAGAIACLKMIKLVVN